MLEDKLRGAKINADERRQLLDEAKRRKQVLHVELEKSEKRYTDAKDKFEFFESEIDHTGQQLRQMERKEMSSTDREMELEDEMRYLADRLRGSQERWFLSDDKVKALARTKESLQGMYRYGVTALCLLLASFVCYSRLLRGVVPSSLLGRPYQGLVSSIDLDPAAVFVPVAYFFDTSIKCI